MTFKVIIELFPSDEIWKSLLFPYSKKIFVITYFPQTLKRTHRTVPCKKHKRSRIVQKSLHWCKTRPKTTKKAYRTVQFPYIWRNWPLSFNEGRRLSLTITVRFVLWTVYGSFFAWNGSFYRCSRTFQGLFIILAV